MAQTNSNNSNVLTNHNASVLTGGATSTANVPTATSIFSPLSTLLNGANASGLDSNTQNGDYATAVVASNLSTPATTTAAVAQLTTLFGNVAAAAHFLPTNGVTVTSGEFFDAAKTADLTDVNGKYLTAASWTATPTKLAGNASTFTLTDTADSGKTFTLAENINGSPFTTGNGAVSEAFTFTGNNSDTLVVKHNVAVANVPAATNNNGGSALDIRNENYAETYTNTKASVNSNYALNTAHKYAEANGNQSLNDARAEAFAYKDAGLTISSSVKTAVADAAYINGVEKIIENNVANYHYASIVASIAGTIDYVVTDARTLAQADQRTYTNITATNVAQFKVVDKTVATNPLTVEASGVIVGTTTNLSTPVTIGGVTQQTTTFAPTNAKFTVNNSNYSLAVDAGQFTKNALNQNVFDNVLDTNSVVGTNMGLGNGGTLFAPITNNGVTNQPVVPATLASAKYFVGTTFTGTDFSDVIGVTDTAVAPFNANIDAGSGNDKITGGFGDDVLTGGTGADTFVVNAGNDKITDFKLGTDALTVAKGTSTATVTVKFADSTSAKYNVTANATTDVTIPATVATKVDLEKIAGVKADNPFDFSSATTGQVIGKQVNPGRFDNDGNDVMIGGAGNDTISGGKGFDTLTGGAGADKFVFSTLTNSDLDTSLGKVTDIITDFRVPGDVANTISGLGAAGTATNFKVVPTPAADLVALLTAADTALNGTVKYYVGQVGTDSYLVTDSDGIGYTDVIQLTGAGASAITAANIIA